MLVLSLKIVISNSDSFNNVVIFVFEMDFLLKCMSELFRKLCIFVEGRY